MDIEYEMLGKDKVVINLRDFETILDLITYDKAKARSEQAFPAELTLQLVAGENPLKSYRKHRGLSQKNLSSQANVPQGLISEIENGKKTGSVNSLKALAQALNIDIDDLV